jgi:hypothetical protein
MNSDQPRATCVRTSAIYLLVYHLLMCLFAWSYFRTMCNPLVGPPRSVRRRVAARRHVRCVQFYVNEIDGEHIATSESAAVDTTFRRKCVSNDRSATCDRRCFLSKAFATVSSVVASSPTGRITVQCVNDVSFGTTTTVLGKQRRQTLINMHEHVRVRSTA